MAFEQGIGLSEIYKNNKKDFFLFLLLFYFILQLESKKPIIMQCLLINYYRMFLARIKDNIMNV